MTMSRELRDQVAKGAPAHVLKDVAVASGMRTLWEEGLDKVRQGMTSMEELESVILLDR
jgi:type II secretory ATPase GspE/PulE/Tfp pilus assembly ATPase PilB-like protein